MIADRVCATAGGSGIPGVVWDKITARSLLSRGGRDRTSSEETGYSKRIRLYLSVVHKFLVVLKFFIENLRTDSPTRKFLGMELVDLVFGRCYERRSLGGKGVAVYRCAMRPKHDG